MCHTVSRRAPAEEARKEAERKSKEDAEAAAAGEPATHWFKAHPRKAEQRAGDSKKQGHANAAWALAVIDQCAAFHGAGEGSRAVWERLQPAGCSTQ